MARPKELPEVITGYIPPAKPLALIVASNSASFAAAVVGLGCDVDRAYRATSLEQARAKQRQWAVAGKASIILSLDQPEGVDGDEADSVEGIEP